MTDIAPGWYRDPVDPQIQRYWDGEAYLGEPLPADATPPPGPPPAAVSAPFPDAEPAPTAEPAGAGAGNSPAAPSTAARAATTDAPATGTPSGQPPGGLPGAGTLPQDALPPGVLPSGAMPPGGWPAYPRLVLPAPRPHGYRLASLGARLVARMIDTLAVFGLNILVNGWFVYQWLEINQPYWQEITRRIYAGESTAGVQPPERSQTLLVIILVLAAALWFAYEVPSLANTGQTFGKRLARIKVMRLDSEEQLGFRRSIRRWNTLGLPTLLWTCFGLGFVLQFVDCLWTVIDRPLHQALHDKSALTVVVSIGQSTPDNQAQGGPA